MQVRVVLSLYAAVICVGFSSQAAASRHNVKPLADTHYPRGWHFTMPKGDPAKGKAVFEKVRVLLLP
jgi:hypothetical protein